MDARAWMAGVLLLAAHAPGGRAEGKTHAVVVGVNRYVDAGLAPLSYCVNDARLMHRVLTGHCRVPVERVVLMTDDQAEPGLLPFQRQIAAEIAAASKRAEAGDTLLVYFSGHGLADAHGAVTLAARDTARAQPAETGLSAAWLKKVLEESPAARKLLILDCCHAGGARAADSQAQQLAPCFAHARGLVTLASCGPEELSQEWPKVKQGLFTWFLAQGLQGAADADGNALVDVDELYRFVYDWVSTTAKREKNARQLPRIYRSGDAGVFVVAALGGKDTPYPVLGAEGTRRRRSSRFRQTYTIRDGLAVYPAEYRETLDAQVRVEQTDGAGRPVAVRVEVKAHTLEMTSRLKQGSRHRSLRGPFHGRTLLQQWRPTGPVALVQESGDARPALRVQPHPLAVDEALLPVLRLKVGEEGEAPRLAQAIRQLLPDANVKFVSPPRVKLTSVEQGGRLLVFEGRGEFAGCLGTPANSEWSGTWRAEYAPAEHLVRHAVLTAESRRISRGSQGMYAVLEYEYQQQPEP